LWLFYLILDTGFVTKWQSEEKSLLEKFLLNPSSSNKITLGLGQFGPQRTSGGDRAGSDARRGGGRPAVAACGAPCAAHAGDRCRLEVLTGIARTGR
jgi:hypothetical protein